MAGATFALGAAVGLGTVTGALGATGAAAFVLTGFDLAGTTALFGLLPDLRAVGAALVFTTGLGGALVKALTGALVTALPTFLAGVLGLATLLTGAVGLVCTPFLAGAALAEVVFTGIATFFFGVVTSCLLAV